LEYISSFSPLSICVAQCCAESRSRGRASSYWETAGSV
jgi:hypothetical protein